MPVGMALLVMLFHFVITPRLSIVSIITFLIPVVALLSNLPYGGKWTFQRIKQHTLVRLPGMRGEVSLFLAAGFIHVATVSAVGADDGSGVLASSNSATVA